MAEERDARLRSFLYIVNRCPSAVRARLLGEATAVTDSVVDGDDVVLDVNANGSTAGVETDETLMTWDGNSAESFATRSRHALATRLVASFWDHKVERTCGEISEAMSAFFRRHDMAPDTKFVLLAGAAQFCLRLRFRLTDLDLFVRDLSSAGVSVHHLGEVDAKTGLEIDAYDSYHNDDLSPDWVELQDRVYRRHRVCHRLWHMDVVDLHDLYGRILRRDKDKNVTAFLDDLLARRGLSPHKLPAASASGSDPADIEP